jgi:hypothetical protein
LLLPGLLVVGSCRGGDCDAASSLDEPAHPADCPVRREIEIETEIEVAAPSRSPLHQLLVRC